MKSKVIFFLMLMLLTTTCFSMEVNGHVVAKVSEIAMIDGISIKTGTRCNHCSDLIFDDNFGFNNPKQVNLMIEILNNKTSLNNDMDFMPYKEYVLEHLVYLATVKQDKDVSSLILYPKSHGGIELDGDMADTFSAERQAQVLLRFHNLKEILIPGTEKEIFENICEEALLVVTDESIINKLIKSFRQRGLNDYAKIMKNERDIIKQKYYK